MALGMPVLERQAQQEQAKQTEKEQKKETEESGEGGGLDANGKVGNKQENGLESTY